MVCRYARRTSRAAYLPGVSERATICATAFPPVYARKHLEVSYGTHQSGHWPGTLAPWDAGCGDTVGVHWQSRSVGDRFGMVERASDGPAARSGHHTHDGRHCSAYPASQIRPKCHDVTSPSSYYRGERNGNIG